MSLNDWAEAGWLKPHKPSRAQIAAIFGVVDRDLEDSKQSISVDARFNIAYNAALQLCGIVLLDDLRVAVAPGKEWQDGADYLDACRGKRNGLERDAAGRVSVTEAKELRKFAVELRDVVVFWLEKVHPLLSPWKK